MKITPRMKKKFGWVRVKLDIKKTEIPRGRKWTKTVNALKGTKKYKLKGASCGIPKCFCDCIAEEVYV